MPLGHGIGVRGCRRETPKCWKVDLAGQPSRGLSTVARSGRGPPSRFALRWATAPAFMSGRGGPTGAVRVTASSSANPYFHSEKRVLSSRLVRLAAPSFHEVGQRNGSCPSTRIESRFLLLVSRRARCADRVPAAGILRPLRVFALRARERAAACQFTRTECAMAGICALRCRADRVVGLGVSPVY
jgi:hypothetical protein